VGKSGAEDRVRRLFLREENNGEKHPKSGHLARNRKLTKDTPTLRDGKATDQRRDLRTQEFQLTVVPNNDIRALNLLRKKHL